VAVAGILAGKQQRVKLPVVVSTRHLLVFRFP
jgi:hypothetical protein